VIDSESRLTLQIAFDWINRLFSFELVRTSPVAIIFFVIAAFLGALGQFYYKSGAEKAGNTLASYILNTRLLAGVVCYVAVMVLFVAAFYASTFIFAAIIAWFAYSTPIRPMHFAGFVLLIAGMYLLGR
jgi:drug/metabolite transporter (DMT)-like permease